MRDYRVDYNRPMFDRNPINLQVDYYIDKVINTNVFNFNKSWTQLEPLRDKYLVVRLIFDKFDNVKLLMNFFHRVKLSPIDKHKGSSFGYYLF